MKKIITLLSIVLTSGSFFSQCSDIFFSEYIEGGFSNKALEIYNPTSATIDLSNYRVHLFTNGSSSPTKTLNLVGMLNSGDVFVIANSAANAGILAVADTTHNVALFTGDDAVSIENLVTKVMIDIIGEIGTDPGSEWSVDTGATKDYTLIRKPNVTEGNMVWSSASTEWDVYPKDASDSLGIHTGASCQSTNVTVNNDITALVSSYPNPTNEEVVLSLGDIYSSVNVTVFNSYGKIVSTQKVNNNSKVLLSLTGAKGFYFAKIITSNNKTAIVKLVKE